VLEILVLRQAQDEDFFEGRAMSFVLILSLSKDEDASRR
jgi:hypothetical protein